MDPNTLAIGAAAISAGVLGCAVATLRTAMRLRTRTLQDAESYFTSVLDKLNQREGLQAEADRWKARALAAEGEAIVYRETLDRLEPEVAGMRVEIGERIEELDLLEAELAATKAALEIETGQANMWADLARGLGYSHDPAALTGVAA